MWIMRVSLTASHISERCVELCISYLHQQTTDGSRFQIGALVLSQCYDMHLANFVLAH
jgi:hypothetical protein